MLRVCAAHQIANAASDSECVISERTARALFMQVAGGDTHITPGEFLESVSGQRGWTWCATVANHDDESVH